MKLDYYSGALLAAILVVIISIAYILLTSVPQPHQAQQPEPAPQTQTEPAPTQQLSPPSCGQITSCTLGDGCCPEGCTALVDYDCPASELGETITSDGLQLQLTLIEERRCIGFSDNEDYLYYLSFDAKIKNLLNRSQFVSYPSFYLLDTTGAKYDPDSVLPHYSCRDNYQDLLLETKYIYPNQSISGEVWIEVNKEVDPLDGTLRIVYDPIPADTGEEFIYSFNYPD